MLFLDRLRLEPIDRHVVDQIEGVTVRHCPHNKRCLQPLKRDAAAFLRIVDCGNAELDHFLDYVAREDVVLVPLRCVGGVIRSAVEWRATF